jgi:hypothetical protein
MKNKLIFLGIIAVIFITAMIIYKDTLTLEGIILIVVANIGSIRLLWLWLNKKEEVFNLKEENKALRVMHKVEFRKNQLNLGNMNDTELSVFLAFAQYINNNLSATHPLKQVAADNVENIQSVIGGGGIKNPPPA